LRAFRAGQPDRARDIWLPLAEAGDSAAQYSLGKLFEHGEGPVPQDLAKAVQWYRTAAAQGLPAAQNNLGLMYAQGRGVPTDLTRAIEIWRAAAEQNYPWSQYNLGLAYYRGQGVPVDQEEAVVWFRLAADGGLAEAQFIMGQLRREGLGLEMDEGLALAWYHRAAEQGHQRARRHAELLRAAGVEPTPSESPGEPAQADATAHQSSTQAEPPQTGSAAEQSRMAMTAAKRESDLADAAFEAKAVDSSRPATQAPPELQPLTPSNVPEAEPAEAPNAGTNAVAEAESGPPATVTPRPKPKPPVVSRLQPQADPAAAQPEAKTAAEPPPPPPSDPVASETVAAKQDGEEPGEPEGSASETKGAFRIWLASARDKATATELWQKMRERHPEVLAGTEATFAEVDLGGRSLVRVLVGPLAGVQSARRLCARLRDAEPESFCKVRSD
jgi:TPR repeat protein